MNWKKTLLICMGILLAGAAATTLIFMTEPTASRSGATKETAMLVDVMEVQRDTFRPIISATGTVQPAKDVLLSPRVSGEIVNRSAAFVPGGYVRKGQVLLQIDSADYKNTLALRRSDLEQVRADLEIEMGRQTVAQQDYQLVEDTLPREREALVLRQPQLNSVKARLKAAEAAVQQAELALQRTTIQAPFDAHILTRNVNVGSQVAPGDNLGRIVGLDKYWVAVTVPLSHLRRISFPEGRHRGSQVNIRNRTAWAEGEYRTGYVDKMVGALEDQTRMARVLVTVRDPLARRKSDAPALLIGEFVEATIQANPLHDVIRLPRDYLRKDETVWVMEDGKLRIRDAEIVFRDSEYAYIAEGLEEGDQVVMTNLTTVVDGAKLRLEGEEETPSKDSTSITAY